MFVYTAIWKRTPVWSDSGKFQGYYLENLITPGAYLHLDGSGERRIVTFQVRIVYCCHYTVVCIIPAVLHNECKIVNMWVCFLACSLDLKLPIK